QREIILLLAWGPAILLQLAHPLVAQGVADHSTFRSSPRGRLRRFQGTLEAMLRLSFGTEAEARLVIARINAIHDHVNGQLTDVARDLARDILYPPALLPVRPALWWTRLVTAGLLPPTIREGYRLSWDARKEAMLSRSASLIRALLPLTPSIVRHWPVARGAR